MVPGSLLNNVRARTSAQGVEISNKISTPRALTQAFDGLDGVKRVGDFAEQNPAIALIVDALENLHVYAKLLKARGGDTVHGWIEPW